MLYDHTDNQFWRTEQHRLLYTYKKSIRIGKQLLDLQTNYKSSRKTKFGNKKYGIPCTCGNVYIGTTTHRISTRLKNMNATVH